MAERETGRRERGGAAGDAEKGERWRSGRLGKGREAVQREKRQSAGGGNQRIKRTAVADRTMWRRSNRRAKELPVGFNRSTGDANDPSAGEAIVQKLALRIDAPGGGPQHEPDACDRERLRQLETEQRMQRERR